MARKRLVIAGGSGFIGRALTREFSTRAFEVIVLTRTPRARTDGVLEVAWDGEHIGAWASLLDGAEAVINLTGKNINCPHTPENLRQIIASRVNSVIALAGAVGQARNPPRVWVQAGAVGFYGDACYSPCDENAPPGHDALADVCQHWEAAFMAANLPETRKIILRVGFVLGRDGGALPVLCKLTTLFLGGAAGNGRQYISWIHLLDLVSMFALVVTDEKLSGTFNAVAPNPVTNAEFMRELRRTLRRPWSPPAPKFAVKIGAWLTKSDASLALASQRCVPKRFLEMGNQFQFSKVSAALDNLCAA